MDSVPGSMKMRGIGDYITIPIKLENGQVLSKLGIDDFSINNVELKNLLSILNDVINFNFGVNDNKFECWMPDTDISLEINKIDDFSILILFKNGNFELFRRISKFMDMYYDISIISSAIYN